MIHEEVLFNRKEVWSNQRRVLFGNKGLRFDRKEVLFISKEMLFNQNRVLFNSKEALFDTKRVLLDNKELLFDSKEVLPGRTCCESESILLNLPVTEHARTNRHRRRAATGNHPPAQRGAGGHR